LKFSELEFQKLRTDGPATHHWYLISFLNRRHMSCCFSPPGRSSRAVRIWPSATFPEMVNRPRLGSSAEHRKIWSRKLRVVKRLSRETESRCYRSLKAEGSDLRQSGPLPLSRTPSFGRTCQPCIRTVQRSHLGAPFPQVLRKRLASLLSTSSGGCLLKVAHSRCSQTIHRRLRLFTWVDRPPRL
jgi:hypothetical protein